MKPMITRLSCATFAAACVAALAACASPEELRAEDRATCKGYGFAEGSDSFASCMMKTANDRQKRNEAMLKANQAAAGMTPKPVSTTECKSTKTTSTTAADGTVTTDSSTLCVSQ